MLAMILIVTAGVFWLSFRSIHLPPMAASTAAALRGGLWLLSFSCALGIGVTVLGEINRAQWRPFEVWGAAGVLKYPHGAAMHAIQFLAVLDWLLCRLRSQFALAAVRSCACITRIFPNPCNLANSPGSRPSRSRFCQHPPCFSGDCVSNCVCRSGSHRTLDDLSPDRSSSGECIANRSKAKRVDSSSEPESRSIGCPWKNTCRNESCSPARRGM